MSANLSRASCSYVRRYGLNVFVPKVLDSIQEAFMLLIRPVSSLISWFVLRIELRAFLLHLMSLNAASTVSVKMAYVKSHTVFA